MRVYLKLNVNKCILVEATKPKRLFFTFSGNAGSKIIYSHSIIYFFHQRHQFVQNKFFLVKLSLSSHYSSPSSVKSEEAGLGVPSHPLQRELCLILKEIKVESKSEDLLYLLFHLRTSQIYLHT